MVNNTESLSSMLAIENTRKNHPILKKTYDKLAELHNQGKQITLCRITARIGIKENEASDKAAKQSIYQGRPQQDYLTQTTI